MRCRRKRSTDGRSARHNRCTIRRAAKLGHERGATTPPARSGRAAVNRTAAPARGDAVFPSAISPKYSRESAGKARMHTCLDQYNANKANNGNGSMRWIERGGGYYSECNRRLKG
jgi:hypothetical protein